MLELVGGRLVFRPDADDGKRFDAPLEEITDISFPAWAGASNLTPPTWSAGHCSASMRGSRRRRTAALSYPAGFKSGKAWKAVLTGAGGK